jgi:hypothetical protein
MRDLLGPTSCSLDMVEEQSGEIHLCLIPKIPSIFFSLPISAVSDLLGEIHFSTKKSMRT